jgi:signal transduction histidine kinase
VHEETEEDAMLVQAEVTPDTNRRFASGAARCAAARVFVPTAHRATGAADASRGTPEATADAVPAPAPATAPRRHRPARGRFAAIVAAALAAGAGVMALELGSDHQDAATVWAIFGPAVGWCFVGTGLYAWRHKPENRTGALMVLLGFAWFLFTLDAANGPTVHTFALVAGGLWGGVFLHLGLSFPAGRLATPRDRRLAAAGYAIFPLAFVPALLFAGPHELGCDGCPANLLLVHRDPTAAHALTAAGAALYLALFAVVLARSVQRWRQSDALERMQLTPVYACALATFLLVTVARAGAGEAAWWAAFVATGVTPFAFLGGLLRRHVSHLDAELRQHVEELRASRARLVAAGDAERRRLERDLHDGAQARLVALALLLGRARSRAAAADPELATLLASAAGELQMSLTELRELARGIHPAVLTDRGLEPALHALADRATVPVRVNVDVAVGRLPGPVECAAYFVASEALQNVAKYAHATHAGVTVRRAGTRVVVEVEDDGIGGADKSRGSGLHGLADRLAALDGTIAVDSPAGRGTRLRAEIPV